MPSGKRARRSGRFAACHPALEEVDLFGVRANRNTMEEIIPLMADGRVPAAKLITHHFPLRDFREALRTFNERIDGALKVIVEP